MKILITYAYAGIGHKKAAQAIEKALSLFSDCEVKNIDTLDYTNFCLKALYPGIYLFLIEKFPFLWGALYYLSDLKPVDILFSGARRFFHCAQAKRLKDFIKNEKPDVIISTHFFPSEVVSELKRKKIFKGKLITVVTDFMPHAFWLGGRPDYFIAAIDRTKKELERRGVGLERIRVLGIPCEPKFSAKKQKEGLMEKLGLEKGLFTVLIMGGGFGTGPVGEIARRLCKRETGITGQLQLIVICGKNIKLFEDLHALKASLDAKLNVFGYMDNIDEFMEVSDCIITKSGGLTVSESLAKKLPMIIINPIPGQETANCKVLTDYGVARRADNTAQAINLVKDFVNFPEKTIGMKARINLLSYPDAARDIAEFARTLSAGRVDGGQ